jgi:N4-bis(aminopropyl)spermidine synthase
VVTAADQRREPPIDDVVAAVAAAVGLAEGRAGVRDILREIARAEPVPVREVSRAVEIPVPLVAAVCNELRSHGVVDRSQPVRLTDGGRAALGDQGSAGAGRCPHCGGLGWAVPAELADLATLLDRLAAEVPAAQVELDQTHCTVDTKIRRVLLLDEIGALAGKRLLVFGDDDLTALAVAGYAAHTGRAAALRGLTVLDVDRRLLDFIAAQAAGLGVPVELIEHDARAPLPAGLREAFDVVCTDPPYTVAGAELFLSRAVSALRPEAGAHVFFSFGARRPDETVRTQSLIAGMGLAVRALLPNFNSYLGAGILAGTSHLYHLRSTGAATPSITGEYAGPLYTADTRAAVTRPYRCAGCRAVHRVGPGERWTRIADLQAAGCPDCAGTVFRPQPRQDRSQPADPAANPGTSSAANSGADSPARPVARWPASQDPGRGPRQAPGRGGSRQPPRRLPPQPPPR